MACDAERKVEGSREWREIKEASTLGNRESKQMHIYTHPQQKEREIETHILCLIVSVV